MPILHRATPYCSCVHSFTSCVALSLLSSLIVPGILRPILRFRLRFRKIRRKDLRRYLRNCNGSFFFFFFLFQITFRGSRFITRATTYLRCFRMRSEHRKNRRLNNLDV